MIFWSGKPPRRANSAHVACSWADTWAAWAEVARRWGVSYVDKIYISEILIKNCSKYSSPSKIGWNVFKCGHPYLSVFVVLSHQVHIVKFILNYHKSQVAVLDLFNNVLWNSSLHFQKMISNFFKKELYNYEAKLYDLCTLARLKRFWKVHLATCSGLYFLHDLSACQYF